jgi:hypothetical protein
VKNLYLAGLEAAIPRMLRERMRTRQVLNPALGCSVRDAYCPGVVITPRFMNSMLLPLAGGAPAEQPSGTRINPAFPWATDEPILADEETIGHYPGWSRFLPVFEFPNQQVAVVTAGDVRRAAREARIEQPLSRRDLLRWTFPGVGE